MAWAKDAQEALDMTLVAYKVSEDYRVLLPSFVAVDGAAITHISVAVEPPTKDGVARFLPPYKPVHPLDPAYGPVTKAQHIAPSLIGPELRRVIDAAMKNASACDSKRLGKPMPMLLEENIRVSSRQIIRKTPKSCLLRWEHTPRTRCMLQRNFESKVSKSASSEYAISGPSRRKSLPRQ